ncbi:ABC transporter substrate-binding protein [Janthinobacterium fluminis]|uniref:ABC transporter substrate-binding protein n=1 Tax=Janthinobacterium fluminis TaxID=2987524 RepID=A0ABT5JXL7_9BURK|nr:ABC transporter substrate-binding protein [Janthinobacterium fluminis]MDC8757319.1 ABC transporter substrate-binding protein [Janthinobacterium fluminis]
MQKLRLAFALVCCSLGWAGGAVAEDGVTAQAIKIGMANATSGPAAGLGLQLRAGAGAYLSRVNAAGGVHGRNVALVSVDDGYDPQQSAAATHTLIEADKVFALFGYVGTPTSTAAVPIAAKAGVPYLFPFTGAEFLRNPVIPVVFNLRASYFDETEALVARLTGELGVKKIGLFIQDDEFGEAGKAGVSRALHKRRLSAAMEARYSRNTIDIEVGLARVKSQAPEAVIFIGTYRPLAALVKKARAAGLKTRFLTVSFVGTSEFIKHAGDAGNGVIISQVMPSPEDGADALVKQYHADVLPAARNYGSLEGYTGAMVLVEALKRCGRAPTRAGLLRTLEQLRMEAGDIPVSFSAQRHQGMDRVYLTQVRDGKAVPFKKAD